MTLSCMVTKKISMTHQQGRLRGGLPTIMRFCVLYYQTIIFTGVYQRWTVYALKPKSVLEMRFCANSKKTRSLGKKWLQTKVLG